MRACNKAIKVARIKGGCALAEALAPVAASASPCAPATRRSRWRTLGRPRQLRGAAQPPSGRGAQLPLPVAAFASSCAPATRRSRRRAPWPTSTAARSCTAAIWPRRSATAPCSRLRLFMRACNKAIKAARTWPTSTAARSCTAAIWPRRSATAPCSGLTGRGAGRLSGGWPPNRILLCRQILLKSTRFRPSGKKFSPLSPAS